MEVWDKCSFAVDIDKLKGRECYGGFDLSSSNDITAFVLIFSPTICYSLLLDTRR